MNQSTTLSQFNGQSLTIVEHQGRKWLTAEHGYTKQDVYRVVNGFAKAQRGKSHRLAVELGLKAAS